MEMTDRILDIQIDRSYMERYKPNDDVQDYICQLDEAITALENLCDEEDLQLLRGYAYCHICDAISLLREAKNNLESEWE